MLRGVKSSYFHFRVFYALTNLWLLVETVGITAKHAIKLYFLEYYY